MAEAARGVTGKTMRARATKRGLVIPRRILENAEEVEIREKDGQIVVSPLSKRDPILNLGKRPVKCGVSDAAENHDRYLYGSAR
jgi:hypothetical protein